MNKSMGSKDKELTQERLKEMVTYCPDTGWFTRNTSWGSLKVGDRTGGSSKGKRNIRIDNIQHAEHRVVFLYMTGEWPVRQVKHLNGDYLDNRWCNVEESILAKDRPPLTQQRLKEIVDYDPDTGLFSRVESVKGYSSGDKIGYKSDAGYVIICIEETDYRAHRLAFLYMEGKWPPEQVDHINRVRDDNRWCNLRECTNHENNKNSSMPSNNTSGHVGVSWDKAREKWAAEIRCKVRGRKRLGRFDSLEDAVAARKAAEVEFGFSDQHGLPAPEKYSNR